MKSGKLKLAKPDSEEVLQSENTTAGSSYSESDLSPHRDQHITIRNLVDQEKVLVFVTTDLCDCTLLKDLKWVGLNRGKHDVMHFLEPVILRP